MPGIELEKLLQELEKEDGKLSFLDRLGNNMLKPYSIPIALLIILLGGYCRGGKALRATLLLPL